MSTDETNPKDEPNNTKIPDPSPGFPESEPSEPSSSWTREKINEEGPDVIDQEDVNEPMTKSEERTWGMLVHLSVLLNLVTGFLGGIAAIIIYFVYKDRSRYVAYHAMQSFIFQSITWIGAGIISAILITIGSVNKGEDFRYWQVGDWVRDILEPGVKA